MFSYSPLKNKTTETKAPPGQLPGGHPEELLMIKLSPQIKRQMAFSLVEVTISLGIVAFALLSLLGLLPVGLMSMHEAIRQTVSTHIVKQISNEVAMIPPSDLPAYMAADRYYDFDGKTVTNKEEAVFIVELEGKAAVYPGSTLLNASQQFELIQISIRRPQELPESAYRTAIPVVNHDEPL